MARQRRRRKYSYINRRSKGAEMSDTEKALVKAYLEERDVLISYKQRAENAEAQLTALRENKFELEGKLASLADTIAAAHRNTNLPNPDIDYLGDMRDCIWQLSYKANEYRCGYDVLNAELAAPREELASVLTDWNALVKASGSPTNGGAVGHVVALKTELAALREKQQGEWNAAIDAAISGARECLLCDADVRWDNNTPQVGDGTAANRAVEYVIKAIRALLRQPSEQPKAPL
jgi:chromosome segregation ATPase